MICRKCGNVISESSKFCSMCGTPVAKECFCATCGQKLPPDARFCTNCGTEQHTSSAETVSTPSVVVKTKQSNFQEPTPKVTIKGGQTGKLLRKMSAVTKFNGEPTVGVANQLQTSISQTVAKQYGDLENNVEKVIISYFRDENENRKNLMEQTMQTAAMSTKEKENTQHIIEEARNIIKKVVEFNQV